MKNLERIDIHGASLRGESHAHNHERFAVADLAKSMRVQQTNVSLEDDEGLLRNTQGRVFLVADGVSGGQAPAKASNSAVRSIVEYFLNDLPWSHFLSGSPDEVTLALEDAFRNAQEDLLEHSSDAKTDMATTLTLAFVNWPHLYVAHVGDGRAYLVRDGESRRLTKRHFAAAIRRRLGGMVRRKNGKPLWNMVGGPNREIDPQVDHFLMRPNDALVLMTDGAARGMAPKKLQSVLNSNTPAEERCYELLEGPSREDRTVVVAHFLPTSGAAVPNLVHQPGPSLSARSKTTADQKSQTPAA